MEKTRVKKGDEYWYVHFGLEGVSVFSAIDFGDEAANFRFECGNYSHTKEEAESMARKLRAVLKGAEVVEMPSEEEFKENKPLKYNASIDYLVGKNFGWWSCVNYIKSKIVK